MQNKYSVLVKATQKQPAWRMLISAQDHREATAKAVQAGAIKVMDCKLIRNNQEVMR